MEIEECFINGCFFILCDFFIKEIQYQNMNINSADFLGQFLMQIIYSENTIKLLLKFFKGFFNQNFKLEFFLFINSNVAKVNGVCDGQDCVENKA